MLVENNTFNLTAANVPSFTADKLCGFMGLFSEYGSTAPYTSANVPIAITFNQNNHFKNNTYSGPWHFWAWAQSNTDNPISFTDWQKGATDMCSTSDEVSRGTCNTGFGQDPGSTLQ